MDKRAALVVEDDLVAQKVLENLLADCGFNATVCSNGTDGLLTFMQRPYHFQVVILDLMLPGLGGEIFLDVIDSLRRRGAMKRSPYILIATGSDNEELISSLAGLSCVRAVCRKPLDRREIIDKLPG